MGNRVGWLTHPALLRIRLATCLLLPPLNPLKVQRCQLVTLTWPYDITHLTLGMLLRYLEKLKSEIFCKYSSLVPADSLLSYQYATTYRLKMWSLLRNNIRYKLRNRLEARARKIAD